MRYIEKKALALVNDVRAEKGVDVQFTSFNRRIYATDEAICRAIEAHEATKQELSDFKQKVSNNVRLYREEQPYIWKQSASGYFSHFIIPAPKPDPLVEAMADCGVDRFESWADQLRAALDARGFEIREKGQ